ncbi:cytochrome c biogenesis protein CcdA (plasmid) [Streptomyces sp. NBC_00637]|uniref:cytochrome c biogenesis CcdA family protein n=1 Tax=Streptomyces sp. NBC_00637 TaxID=2903667 RepID=UPI002F9095C7
MSELLFGTTLLASFIGGMVALLAPCCISVMLPAYFASGFRSRGRVLAATLAFGAGVATVIVPIGLGAAAASAALVRFHLEVYLAGGALMLLGGLAVLYGWKPNLPMPSRRSPQGGGFGAAYALGAFSGIASACCAPVLAGVAVLSGATASFPAALSVGLVYVLGMVAPLVVIALAWERGRRGPARVLQGRRVRLRIGRRQRGLPLGDLLSGVLLVGMGVLTVVLAITGPSMPNSGWRVTFAADLQHAASTATHALAWLPGWALALAAAAALALLIRRALRPATPPGPEPVTDRVPETVPAAPEPAEVTGSADLTTTMETRTDGR